MQVKPVFLILVEATINTAVRELREVKSNMLSTVLSYPPTERTLDVSLLSPTEITLE